MNVILRDWRVTWFGFLSWAIPLAASFACFGPGGKLWMPQPIFKSAMVVVGGGVAAWLLVRTFRRVTASRANGIAIGLYWLVLNLGLDLLILVPLTHMDIAYYFEDIGLHYLLIPIMSVAMAARPTSES